MQIRFYVIPARGDAGLQADMNVFLRSRRMQTNEKRALNSFVGMLYSDGDSYIGKRGKSMQAIEIDTQIGKDGNIRLPAEYHSVYGKSARLVVLFPLPAQHDSKERLPGSAKGVLRIVSEDDEHLGGFTEYMP